MTLPQMDTPVALSDLPALENKWVFVGLDLAPVDSLETGMAVIDRERNILRMDKIETDREILKCLESLGPKDGIIIALDIPKSLSFTSKWRQQQIKMHPLRLLNQDDNSGNSRFAKRADNLYHHLISQGYFVINFFSHYAKLRYNLNVPYRSRSPQGCRALQAGIKEHLKIKHTSSNLAPSSVLDAMIGAYIAWQVYAFQMLKTRYQVQLERQKTPVDSTTQLFEQLERSKADRFRHEKPRYDRTGQDKPIKILKKLVEPEQPFNLYQDSGRRLFFDPLTLLSIPRERRFRSRF